MNKELLKQRICEAIDANKEKICAIGQHIFENPELGYKEFLTSELVQKTFDELNISYEKDFRFCDSSRRFAEYVSTEANACLGKW